MLAVLHVVASVNPNVGGPAATVPGLAAALSARGVRTSIASLDYREHGRATEAPGVTNVTVEPGTLGKRLRGWSPVFRAAIGAAAADGVDVIHHHGLWMIPGIYARRVARRLDLPLVISPRGMLDRWSLERSSARKAIATIAFERRNLEAARLIHATSDLEALAIRRFGLTQPIAIIPNGVNVPHREHVPPRAAIEAQFPELAGRRWLLYMGRLHPKKGLDLLIDAWRALAVDFPDWRLIVAGPDQSGYRAELEATVAGCPELRKSVTFTGMLDGLAKSAALHHARLFVLPSRSENFGVAVAEALAHGVPVVTTTAAPWSDLAAQGCGWSVVPERRAIADALRAAMEHSPDELHTMGERGRHYASSRFAWDAIGARMAEVYRWILNGGARPDGVHET